VVATAGEVPTRVVVRNIGGSTLSFAFNMGDLTPEVTSESYKLPPLLETVFVLAPRQSLYAVSDAIADGAVSASISEALPLV
jgi:hypothetical protein